MVPLPLTPLDLGPVNSGYGRNSTIHIGQWFRTCTISWRICLSPASYCHLDSTVTESPRTYSTIPSSQLLQDGREYDKTSEFHENESLVMSWAS